MTPADRIIAELERQIRCGTCGYPMRHVAAPAGHVCTMHVRCDRCAHLFGAELACIKVRAIGQNMPAVTSNN